MVAYGSVVVRKREEYRRTAALPVSGGAGPE
jgi:hypothetical protein